MKRPACLIIFLFCYQLIYAQHFISAKKEPGNFTIASNSQVTSLYVDDSDDWLVNKAASLLQLDIEMVTGKKPSIIHDLSSSAKSVIIVGTIEHSSLIKKLTDEKKLDAGIIKGKWEAFQLQTVSRPVKGIDHALVITGS